MIGNIINISLSFTKLYFDYENKLELIYNNGTKMTPKDLKTPYFTLFYIIFNN